MTEQEQKDFDAVCKWCDDRLCTWTEDATGSGSELITLDVGSLWVLEHEGEFLHKAEVDEWPERAIHRLNELVKQGKRERAYQAFEKLHGEKVMAFFKQMVVLKANFDNYKLFRTSASFRKQFLQIHNMISVNIWDSIVIQFARLLTDGKEVAGHKVLTIDTLVDEVLKNNAIQKKTFIKRISEAKQLPVVKRLKKEWRHNRLAHNNYEAALGITTTSPLKISEVEAALGQFIGIFQDLSKQLGNSYDINAESFTIQRFSEEIAGLGFDQYAQSNPWIKDHPWAQD